MSWEYYYIKTPDESTLIQLLPILRSVSIVDPNTTATPVESWTKTGLYHALDIGNSPIYGITCIKVHAVYDTNNKLISPDVLDDGFHVNLALDTNHPQYDEIVNSISEFSVQPKNPQQKWAT